MWKWYICFFVVLQQNTRLALSFGRAFQIARNLGPSHIRIDPSYSPGRIRLACLQTTSAIARKGYKQAQLLEQTLID